MFKINDAVVYSSYGVCKIVDIRTEICNKTETLFYVLKPVDSEGSTLFCPVENENMKIRKPMSKKDVEELIKLLPEDGAVWIENDKQRKEKYNDVLKNGSQEELAKLIKTLYFNRKKRLASGKKVLAVDEKIMKDAETVLYSELAYVLKIKPDEVVDYLSGELEKIES